MIVFQARGKLRSTSVKMRAGKLSVSARKSATHFV
jgi:hypothetical protein